MTNAARFLPILRRELKSYLTSPAVYVAAALYLFLTGLFFYGIMINFSELSGNEDYRRQLGIEEVNFTLHVVKQVFWSSNFLLLFVVPAITMRLIAEERKTGTFELLKSLPFSDWNIILGKFFAAYALVAGLAILNSYQTLIMMRFGAPELKVIAVGLIGTLIVSAAYVAIGLFASALTENQIVAALTAFVLLMLLFLAGDVSAPGATGIGQVFELISMRVRSEQFTLGLLRSEDVAYFGLLTCMFLFLTSRCLEIPRWRI